MLAALLVGGSLMLGTGGEPVAAATASAAPAPSPALGATEMKNVLLTIRTLESRSNYTEHSHSQSVVGVDGSGNPTGAYQYVAATWNGYRGYAEAYLAPSAVQDERAAADVAQIIARLVTVDWVPVAWYVGTGNAALIKAGKLPLTWLPNPKFNTLTVGAYQTRWLAAYRKLPSSLVQVVSSADVAPDAVATRGSAKPPGGVSAAGGADVPDADAIVPVADTVPAPTSSAPATSAPAAPHKSAKRHSTRRHRKP